MGDVGKTFFGGSDSSQNSSSSSSNLAYPGLQQSLGSSVNFLPNGGNFMGALLGIPGYGTGSGGAPAPTPAPLPGTGGGPGGGLGVGIGQGGGGGSGVRSYSMARDMAATPNGPRSKAKPGTGGGGTPAPTPTPTPTPAPVPAGGPSPQQNALQTFTDSAGMKFLQDNGTRMLNNNAASKGLVQSGATLKGIEDYGNQLNSTYLNQYLDKVMNFSKLGEMAAGTLAGAGQVSKSTGTGSSSSKPGILPGMQQAAASMAAAG
jgi:hypothetical protein